MFSGFMKPSLWDETIKESFHLLRETEAWKSATEYIDGLKNVLDLY